MPSVCFLVWSIYFGFMGYCFKCSGIIIQTLADASHNQHIVSAPQIMFNVAGFCITAATTVIVTLYAKRRLKELQMEELLVLR